MLQQLASTIEPRAAFCALVLLGQPGWLVDDMDQPVFAQIIRPGEFHTAHVTRVRFHVRMDGHVFIQVRRAAEELLTKRAPERLLTCMSAHVRRQVTDLDEVFVALVTFVRSFSGVQPQMSLQITVFVEALFTVGALEWLVTVLVTVLVCVLKRKPRVVATHQALDVLRYIRVTRLPPYRRLSDVAMAVTTDLFIIDIRHLFFPTAH